MKRHIPNLITSLNVLAGTAAIFTAFHGHPVAAAALVLAAMVFDFFDGLAARALHVKSDIGRELDSLADVVSFGVAPAVLAHLLMLDLLPGGSVAHWGVWTAWERAMACAPLLVPAFSAYRLAKFNVDTRQATSFIGMPTPANALFWVGLVFGSACAPDAYGMFFGRVSVLGICALVLSVLLVSELPMFSLKVSGFGWRGNEVRYVFLAALALSACLAGWGVLFLVVPLYLLCSLAACASIFPRS